MQFKTPPIKIERYFDTSKSNLFKYWSEEEYYKKWFGPTGFTCPVANIDFRVGGICHSCMRDSEGHDFWSLGKYIEIIPNEKIVCTDSFSNEKGDIILASEYGLPGEWPAELLVTITFEEKDGKTMMTILHEGLPIEMQEDCKTGWNMSFDKIDKLL